MSFTLKPFPGSGPGKEPFEQGVDRGIDEDDFWNPTDLKWYSLPVSKYATTQLPIPEVALPEPLSKGNHNAWLIYREVEQVGAIVSPIYARNLYWSPRSGRWFQATEVAKKPPPPPPPRPCVPAMTQELASIDALHAQGTLHDDEWRTERLRIIHNCLGG